MDGMTDFFEVQEIWAPEIPCGPRKKGKRNARRSQYQFAEARYARDGAFRCIHCGNFVPTNRDTSGVGHRNHCPVCLWSRHLDLHRGGDRLSVCKAPMRPVGLTVKKADKKYAHSGDGELMLIHECTECGRLSINRVAADDLGSIVVEVFTASLHLEPALRAALLDQGITPLGRLEESLVHRRLFGDRNRG